MFVRSGDRYLSPGVICLAGTLTAAQQEGEVTVADIRIEGNQTIPESVILQKIQAQPQRAISERLIREDIRSLMSTRWFFNVKERLDDTPDGLILVYTVHEKPIVQRVEFRGNKKIKLKHLTAWTGLKAGSPFDARANQEAVNRIEQEYKDKGYYFAKGEHCSKVAALVIVKSCSRLWKARKFRSKIEHSKATNSGRMEICERI